MPTIIEVGVARPNAHGQAMISTVTNVMSAKVSDGSGPKSYQTTKDRMAMTMTTGTK